MSANRDRVSSRRYDAVVVGSGPNGLAAAVTVAREGFSVLELEANEQVGGGVRSAQLTLPGFVHDVCSAVFPLGVGSPFFRSLPLADHGVRWIHPPAPLAHPFGDGTAALLERSLETTGRSIEPDAAPYRRLMEPLARDWEKLMDDVLAPVHLPRHPWVLARFGRSAVRSAVGLARSRFRGPRARALFAGVAAHSTQPL